METQKLSKNYRIGQNLKFRLESATVESNLYRSLHCNKQEKKHFECKIKLNFRLRVQ